MAKKKAKKTKKAKKPQLIRHPVRRYTALFDAAVKAGFREKQILSFASEEDLKLAVSKIKPELIFRLEDPSKKKPVYPKPQPKLVDKIISFDISVDSRTTATANHAACEEMYMQSYLRGKYIRNIQTIRIVRPLVPNKEGKLISKITVNYKETVS